ncbi:hypothetical protein [Raoultella ornithinolytica]|uniref:hypothetical protein n=1 Tax=Raoultella ornithinolytica TaxID=54291 RepID=UPI0010A4EDE2|nr:hypothetical protein [Raoultella ornithinolytica]MEB5728202.1 hypothetical protein [Raoultella ornithinolytica]THE44568.1 hypothetical protein DJ495_06410 [Raoultella ornithinolytica]
MSSFNYETSGELVLGFYENDKGTVFQSQVKLSDYDSELLAAAAAQALGEQYSTNYEEKMNDSKTDKQD